MKREVVSLREKNWKKKRNKQTEERERMEMRKERSR